MSDYSVAVGAPNCTLGNFSLGLRNAFCVADVHGFGAAIQMVKVKRPRVIKPAVNAASIGFVFAYPVANALRTSVGFGVYLLPVARLLQPIISPLFALLWNGCLTFWTRSALTKSRAILGESFGFKLGQAMGAVVKQWGRVIVGFHGFILSYPCKPDIFEMTYEAVE